MSRAVPVEPDFDAVPSYAATRAVAVTAMTEAPPAGCVGVLVTSADGVDGAAAAGFTAAPGSVLTVPSSARLLVYAGVAADADAAAVRDAAAAIALAAKGSPVIAVDVSAAGSIDAESAAQAVVEGVLLARYEYVALRARPQVTPVTAVTVVSSRHDAAALGRGAATGRVTAAATALARDLANCPPAHLTAARLGDIAAALGPGHGFEVEVADRDRLVELGCGGLIGVNGGSQNEPRMVVLRYRPESADRHVAIIGKGIMYDSGGIALKPADATHANMKNDMSGAAAILAAFTTFRDLGVDSAVSGWLMCTDNMPGGSALCMGDVITAYGGMTVEVANTDAEGRLVMMDGLALAAQEQPDVILDIATLTGAAMRALGTRVGVVIGNSQSVIDAILGAGRATDERMWQLPLERAYRRELDSEIADIKNLGGPNAGSITAALFLEEFVAGIPWAHIDIAGTAQADPPGSWRPEGCTGFGARLLAAVLTAPR